MTRIPISTRRAARAIAAQFVVLGLVAVSNAVAAAPEAAIDAVAADADQAWITENLIRPEANIIFVMSISKQMLDGDVGDSGRLAALQATELEALLAAEPDNAAAMLGLANHEVLAGRFDSARGRIDTAYTLSPGLTEVYLSELLYQLYDGLIKLSALPKGSPSVLPVSEQFFLAAEQQHPDLLAPQIVRHSLDVLQIFYSAIFRHLDAFKQRQAFSFVLDEETTQRLAQSREYFLQLAQQHQQSDTIAKLMLLVIAIVKGDTAAADSDYRQLAQRPEADNNLHRLMMLNDVMQADFEQAIEHLERSIRAQDNDSDRALLAKFHGLQGEYRTALSVLLDYQGPVTANLLVQRLAYAILSGSRQASAALYTQYQSIAALHTIPDFLYYSMVISLLHGDTDAANNWFDRIPDESIFKANGRLFLRRFSG